MINKNICLFANLKMIAVDVNIENNFRCDCLKGGDEWERGSYWCGFSNYKRCSGLDCGRRESRQKLKILNKFALKKMRNIYG